MGPKKICSPMRIEGASLEQLDVWLDPALDAKVVEEVFARNGARRLFALVMLAERLEQRGEWSLRCLLGWRLDYSIYG